MLSDELLSLRVHSRHLFDHSSLFLLFVNPSEKEGFFLSFLGFLPIFFLCKDILSILLAHTLLFFLIRRKIVATSFIL